MSSVYTRDTYLGMVDCREYLCSVRGACADVVPPRKSACAERWAWILSTQRISSLGWRSRAVHGPLQRLRESLAVRREKSVNFLTMILPQSLLYMPAPQHTLKIAKPIAIPKLSLMTFNLLPLTSFHPTGTSTMGMSALSASINISTSKIQPSLCMYGMMCGREGREKSLKPHWVSLMCEVFGVVRVHMRRWKARMRVFRRSDR